MKKKHIPIKYGPYHRPATRSRPKYPKNYKRIFRYVVAKTTDEAKSIVARQLSGMGFEQADYIISFTRKVQKVKIANGLNYYSVSVVIKP